MNQPPENSQDHRSHPGKEYEDPHYHDEDLPLGDDPPPEGHRPKAPGKSRRRVPPPRRWHQEE